MACLAPGQGCSIEIYVQSAQIGPTASLVRDKFLITANSVDDANMPNQRIGEIMKVRKNCPASDLILNWTSLAQTGKPDSSYRLRCVLAAAVDGVQRETVSYNEAANVRVSGGQEPIGQKQAEQIDRMSRKVILRLFIVKNYWQK